METSSLSTVMSLPTLVEDFTRSRINGNDLNRLLTCFDRLKVEDFTRSRINGNISNYGILEGL